MGSQHKWEHFLSNIYNLYTFTETNHFRQRLCRSCAVIDVDINIVEKDKVKIIPDELWLSNHPNICIYKMTAYLSNKSDMLVTQFVIANFSPTEHLHLIKDQFITSSHLQKRTIKREKCMKSAQ